MKPFIIPHEDAEMFICHIENGLASLKLAEKQWSMIRTRQVQEMMKKEVCYHCKGVGKVPDGYIHTPIVECPTCYGSGLIERRVEDKNYGDCEDSGNGKCMFCGREMNDT